MKCSIVKTSQSIAKMDHEKLGLLCGLGFIKLRHKKQFEEYHYQMRGFQGANIYFSNYNGKKMYTYDLTVDRASKDSALPKNLIFEPSEETNELLAILPDTKFNRRVLACYVGSDLEPEILDDKIQKEVKEMAKTIRTQTIVKKKKDQLIVDQSKVIQSKDERIAQLERELAEKNAVDNVILDAAQTIAQDSAEAYKAKIRQEIKDQVYVEKADLISTLKESYGEKWAQCSEYKQTILKEVTDRTAKRLAEEGITIDVDSRTDS